MKCTKCGRTLAEDQRYVSAGRVFCEDCLMDIGLSVKECDPWATYVDTHAKEASALKGTVALTVFEKDIYEFIKSKGRVATEEVMRKFSLSEPELRARLITLFHSELVKERSEGGRFHLVAIG